MSMIKAVATSCLLAMRGAAAVGLGFDGTAPFAEHVWVQGPPEGARRAADWSVVVGEVTERAREIGVGLEPVVGGAQ